MRMFSKLRYDLTDFAGTDVMPKKTTTRRQPSKRSHQSEAAQMGERFERAFCVFDSAITGALLTGVNPYTFVPLLSFHFLQVSLGASEKPSSDPARALDVFESVLKGVRDEFDDNQDGAPDLLEKERFFELKTACIKGDLSELDRRRDTKKAMAVIEWCFQRLSSDEELEVILVELALLVAYLKVTALSEEIDEMFYLKARENPPRLLMAYHGVLER